ncbi:MAG: pilus assembly protein [Chloroflexi bacterium]|nr:pilus assembly protein [Chloroflexota bacterium]
MRHLLRREQAQSVIELALLLPFLLLLILGTIEIGRSFRIYMTLNNAAREGAAWLAHYPSDPTGARTLATTEAARVGLTASQLTITITPVKSKYAAGDNVTFKIVCAYPLMFGALTKISTISFSAQVTMRVLYD